MLSWMVQTMKMYVLHMPPSSLLYYSIYLQLKDSLLSVYFLQLAKVCWWYYFSKLVEFFDTVSTPMKLKAGMHNCPSLHVWLLNHFTNIL